MKRGTKVGLIWSETDSEIRFLGYGKYQKKEIPEDGIGLISEMYRNQSMKTQKFKLDDGPHVWGSECYWDTIDNIENKLQDGRSVLHIRFIREIRDNEVMAVAVVLDS